MTRRRIVIGVIGGDRQVEWARMFGRAVAEAGCILLTGGGDRNDQQVKNATFFGTNPPEQAAIAARAIGILPAEQGSDAVAWNYFAPPHLLLETGLPHNVRNLINGVTPDVVVAFGGSRGTLAEMAFAAAARKPLYFYGTSVPRESNRGLPDVGAVERLLGNYRKYFRHNNSCRDIEEYLEAPLRAFPRVIPETSEQLIVLMERTLESAGNWRDSATALVQSCMQAVDPVSLDEPTGFPGLPGYPASKEQFEDFVRKISDF